MKNRLLAADPQEVLDPVQAEQRQMDSEKPWLRQTPYPVPEALASVLALAVALLCFRPVSADPEKEAILLPTSAATRREWVAEPLEPMSAA